MPVPVRALWASASEEERARAHRTATAVLRTWLGKTSREEAAQEVGVSRLRFWQLSQQAVAGLVAGLLRQPRYRGAGLPGDEESPGSLKRRLRSLERELEGARRLIGLLQELPANRERPPQAEGADGGSRRGRRRMRRGASAPGTGDDGAAASGGGTEDGHGERP